MSRKEIITLHFGPQSCHAGAHFWAAEAQEPSNASLFRVMRNRHGSVVNVPRTVFCDAHDSEAFRSNGQRWHQASRSQPVRPTADAGGFDDHSDGGMPGVSSRVTWDSCLDAAGLVLHPSCTLPVGGRSSTGDLVGSAAAASLSCASPLDAFTDGAALWDEESMLEPLRWHLEDCDALHGVVAAVDVDGGWGGLAVAFLEAARDSMLPKGAGIAVYGLLGEAGAAGAEGEDDETAGREARGAGAGAGACGSRRSGASYRASGSAAGSGSSAAASDGPAAAGAFNYGTRNRAALRSVNCAMALHAFGREAAERIGCTLLPVGAGDAAGAGGSGPRAARLTAAAMSLLLDCTRPAAAAGHAAGAGGAGATAAGRLTGSGSRSACEPLRAGDGRVPAAPWDCGLETTGGAPLASLAEAGVPLASLLAFLTQGSSGVHVATTRLALPLTSAPGGPLSRDAAPAQSSGISASALKHWLPSPASYFAAGPVPRPLESLNWGAVTAVLASAATHSTDARAGPSAASVPLSHLAVLRGVGAPEAAVRLGAGPGSREGGGFGSAASTTASRSRGAGASSGATASGVASPPSASSSAAAYGRALDGWLETWRCPSAAHRVIGAGLPVSLCSWGRGGAVGGAEAAPSGSASSAAAFMHVAVGADAAALLRAGAVGVAAADRSVLWRYGADLDVGQLVDELSAAAEELGGSSAAEGDDEDFE